MAAHPPPVTVLVGKSGRGKTQAMKFGMATIGKKKFLVNSNLVLISRLLNKPL